MNIQNIGIFYFSGTGNTKLVANLFANEFKMKGFSTKLIPIEDVLNKKIALSIGDYDLLGFGHPVHAFSAPKIFFDFLDMEGLQTWLENALAKKGIMYFMKT